MSDKSPPHLPVLLEESIGLLNIKDNGTYVDGTLGAGGHTERLKIQNPKLKIIGIDTDRQAIAAAKQRLAKYNRIKYVRDNFKNLKKILTTKVDGILLDLGVSSCQIDQAGRGFSLRQDGPLDMRMDQSLNLTAAMIVNRFSREELIKIFSEYGEERFAKRIGKAICVRRNTKQIQTTLQLKEIIEKAIPSWKKRESVTRIFQALRIAVNQELENLTAALRDVGECLKPAGRIVIISYHSLEDRIAKQSLKKARADNQLRILTKKPLRPSAEEISANPRAKSAKLRAGEKL